MRYLKTKVNFRDARGEIRDILAHVTVDAVTLITCAKNSVRGNHFHKLTAQYTYVWSGKFVSYTRRGERGKVHKRIVQAGDLLLHAPGEQHTFQALTAGVLMQLSYGPRCGKDYEKDTYRLAEDKKLAR